MVLFCFFSFFLSFLFPPFPSFRFFRATKTLIRRLDDERLTIGYVNLKITPKIKLKVIQDYGAFNSRPNCCSLIFNQHRPIFIFRKKKEKEKDVPIRFAYIDKYQIAEDLIFAIEQLDDVIFRKISIIFCPCSFRSREKSF